MLKFWKNAGRGKSKFPTRPPEPSSQDALSSVGNFATAEIRAYNFENIPEDDNDEEVTNHSSRLSKSLQETLADKKSLSYFTQYLESVSSLPLIDFWIEVESFKDAAKLLYSQNTSAKPLIVTHQTVNRTVSFDSSISTKTSDQFNGFTEKNKCTSFNETKIDQNDSSNLRASCSNITNGDGNNGTKANDFKKVLLDDAVRIFKKFIALESPQRLDVPEDVRNMIISSICHPEGRVDPDIFKVVQSLAENEMSAKHFEVYIQSAYHCKYQIEVLASGTLTIEDIIYNQMAMFYFMEYLEQEHCSLLMEFVMAVINFREQLQNNTNYDGEEAQNDAIILYDKYFSLQATSSLGFSADVRLNVEENICLEGGRLSPHCFHKPFKLVLNLLRQYIATFLTSQLYYKYLSEMISSIQGGWHSNSKHKKSASDCSSEVSVSARNTLLAMGDFPSAKNNQSSMRIDSKQLYNGDLLWRRKTDKGLCLGRVNSLGRFESCMEPEPEKKDPSVIQRVVSRLVSGDKDRAKEELAWQVAHMIVKDITDVTLGGPDNQL